MAWTQADIDALKAAIASGLREVEYSNGRQEYQNTEQMLLALRIMQAEVNAATAVQPYKTRYVTFNPWRGR